MMNHIVIIHHGNEIGGAEMQSLILAQGLKSHGYRVTFVGLSGAGKLSQWVESRGFYWVSLVLGRPHNRFGYLKALLRFVVNLRSLKPDAILGYCAWPNIITGLGWKMTGAKYGIWGQRDEGRELYGARIEKIALCLASSIISNSEHAGRFLQEQYRINPNKIQIINNGVAPRFVDENKRLEIRQSLALNESIPVASMAANLHHHKDHQTLLKAWKIVLECWPNKSELPVLLLIGRPGNTWDMSKALAFDLALGQQVRFLGFRDDVPDLLIASDLCVFSSQHEGVPNGILESMSLGLPIVGTDIPGIREAVGQVGYSYLAPAGNEVQLADNILKVLLNYDLRTRLGNSMKERIKEKFNPATMVASYEKCIQDLS